MFASFHRRVVEAGTDVRDEYGLVLAGGYAIQAHGLMQRPRDNLDFATSSQTPLPEIAEAVASAYRNAGFEVRLGEFTPRMGRMLIVDPVSELTCELDLLKEALQRPPAILDVGPVVSLDDAVGMKVRALANRSVARDFIDVAAAGELFPFRELERLCALHDEDFRVPELLERLDNLDCIADAEFEAYGLSEDDIHRIRRFALAWADDIRLRRVEDGDSDVDYFYVDDGYQGD